ncbi:MAG: plastocyanin/azurin family copper-binding protein [Pseudonocardiaceae bacterium]
MGKHRERVIGASGRAVLIVGAAAALLLGSTACGGADSDEDGGSSDAAPAGLTVEVKDFTYTPTNLTVPTGATVTWKFEDSAPHDVLADDESFRSPLLNDGETYQFTFTKPGSYPYICSVHPRMMGTVTVQ